MVAEPKVPSSLVAAFAGQYELIREIGHGHAAAVYVARDIKHDRAVAIKVLHTDVSKSSGERFLREIRVTAKMQHPHILPTYDSGMVEGRMFFVMPFVDGGSLRDRLNAAKSLPVAESLQIARQVGVALVHAHAAGIVHRDVKPENIMFYHGTACLADFGIARPLEELEPGITAHGTLVGTPGYMSPEQFLTVYDGRSDLYSLCCVLYEMIAGAKLFSGNTPQELVERRSYLLAKSREAGPELPPYVDRILDRGLARAPHHRFDDAAEFVAAIDDAIAQTERPARRNSAERALASLRYRKAEIGLAAAILVLLGIALWPKLRQTVGDRSVVSLQGAPAPVSDTPFETGKAALEAWDIPRAQAELAAAVARDPANVSARLWLAESYALARRTGREDFRVAARQLESYRGRFTGRDSLLAEGLVALASARHAEACRAYAAQLHRDTLDVLAWYGLGDCHALDTTVVEDRKSPSGWRFVSSYSVANHAYRRAVELVPASRSAVPFSLLMRILPVTPSAIRRGRSADGRTFYAYPALAAETLAFVPYPMALFQAAAPATISPLRALAIDRNQEVLLAFAKEWVEAARENPDAWEALALARELRGDLSLGNDGAGSALRNARKLATTPAQQLRLAASEVRLAVKNADFRGVREKADSIFEANGLDGVSAESADVLAGLAALTGRVEATARFQAAATAATYSTVGVAPQLAAAGARFFAHAAPGTCGDTLRALRSEFDRVLESYTRPDRRSRMREIVLWQPAALAFPCLGADAIRDLSPTSPLDRAQRAFLTRNREATRAILDSISASRAGYRPGDVSLDFTVQEAWLRAASGDSIAAQRQLDLVLDALPTLEARRAVQEVAQSAAVGRAMVLRADLALARGDHLVAKRWARNVVELWASADASLKPTLDRMRTIAR